MDRITKRFGRQTVLDGVSLELHAGEVHALLGCNGAGKSTLLKILGGVHTSDEGSIHLANRSITPRSPAHAARLGIAVIHQELSLVPALSVADNLLLGRPMSRLGFLLRGRERAEAEKRLAEVGLDIDPDKPVEQLSLAERQLVEIAKALGFGASVLVMDEPTSALTAPSVDRLFELVRSLCARGVAVVYVSHRMDEIARIAHRLTVLRDGRVAGRALVGEATVEDIVAWMLGPRAAAVSADPSGRAELTDVPAAARLEVENFSITSSHSQRLLVDAVSFSVSAGEIVGCFGLSGAGANDLVAALFGASSDRTKGIVRLDGQAVNIGSPRDAAALGIGFVPADRKTMGIVPLMTSAHNATLAVLSAISPLGWIRNKKDRDVSMQAAERTGLSPAVLERAVVELSGGNQQKVVLGKWLVSDPRLLLLDDPTRGVDVGAKAEIYARLRALAGGGAAVFVAGSDAEELVELCNRILVLRKGKIVATVRPGECNANRLLALAMSEHDGAVIEASA
ncbi:MAG: sugar ABC transporter ATP-binding protein [Polyangiaceae bacterium]|nr:sugar ABC transporter ATP-binding protein [Polyangiaceae bacterium]